MKKILLLTILASLAFPSFALGMENGSVTGEISIGEDEEKTQIMYKSVYHKVGCRCLPQGDLTIQWSVGRDEETLYFVLEACNDPSMTADGVSFLDIYNVKGGEIESLSDNSFAVTETDSQTKIALDWSLPKTGLFEKTDLVLRVSENKDMEHAKVFPFLKIMPDDTPNAAWHASSWNMEDKEYLEKCDAIFQEYFAYRQENGTYMIPGRFWVEEAPWAARMKWKWNEEKKSFHVFRNEKEYVFTAGQNNVSVNGQKFYFMTAPEIVGGRIYLPLDMMKVMWNDKSEIAEQDGVLRLIVCV